MRERYDGMRVVIAAGGTAGHINPGLAIAKYIREKNKNSEILFIGTKEGLETKLVPREGFNIHYIDVRGLRRSLSLRNIATIKKVFDAKKECKNLFAQFKPDIVIGMGGYVSAPVILAAKALGIPRVLHEQNSIAGAAIKLLEKKCDIIFTSFEETTAQLKNKKAVIVCGNPVREEIIFKDKKQASEELKKGVKALTFSYGGSLGSKKLNDTIVEYLLSFDKTVDTYHIHATGKNDYAQVCETVKVNGFTAKNDSFEVVDYVYDMATVMAAADLIICRSGAITLAELAATGKPSILIPSPNVTHNHQYHNAKVFADKGAAVLIREEELTAKTLAQAIKDILETEGKLEKMSKNARKLAKLDSTQKMYDECVKLINGKRGK